MTTDRLAHHLLKALLVQVVSLCLPAFGTAMANDKPDYELELTDSQQEAHTEDLRFWLLDAWSKARIGLLLGYKDVHETVDGSSKSVQWLDYGVGFAPVIEVAPHLSLTTELFSGYSSFKTHSDNYRGAGANHRSGCFFLDGRMGLAYHHFWYIAEEPITHFVYGFGVGGRSNSFNDSRVHAAGDAQIPEYVLYPYLTAGYQF